MGSGAIDLGKDNETVARLRENEVEFGKYGSYSFGGGRS
jgi:hypothetical protein